MAQEGMEVLPLGVAYQKVEDEPDVFEFFLVTNGYRATNDLGVFKKVTVGDSLSAHAVGALKEMLSPYRTVMDRFGNRWPDRFHLCRVCRQPDNCGDCDHTPLTPKQVDELGGTGKAVMMGVWNDQH